MSFIDVTGQTEEEAIRKALEQLQKDRDDVSVEILERAKSGFLGIGSSPAKVRVTYADPEPAAAPVPEKKAEPKPEKKPDRPQQPPKAAAPVVHKLLSSAIANAVNNNEMDRKSLYVAEVYANPGPTLKRYVARSRGSASPMLKRTSHISVVLDQK